MTEEKYQELLKTAPDHRSQEFIDFLKENNVVVWEGKNWLIIENCKYGNGWRTAFWLHNGDDIWASKYLHEVYSQYPECKIIIKSPAKRTVKRFHFHIVGDYHQS